jgi:hypothetical protein
MVTWFSPVHVRSGAALAESPGWRQGDHEVAGLVRMDVGPRVGEHIHVHWQTRTTLTGRPMLGINRKSSAWNARATSPTGTWKWR